jgi:hypothetical protein
MYCAARGFSHRVGPADRFIKRFTEDETATLEQVVTAVRGGVVVGGARLFDRMVWVSDCGGNCSGGGGGGGGGGYAVRLLGWGEVSSDPDLRGQGIVGRVLAELSARMERAAGEGAPPPRAALGLLHAAPGVAGLYAKFGFSEPGVLRIPYARLRVAWAGGGGGEPLPAAPRAVPGAPQWRVRRVDFSADAPALAALREGALARAGAAGWTLRSGGYWARWVANVCRGRAGVLETEAGGVWAPTAYGFARWREGAFRLMDWAGAGGLGGGAPLRALLEALLADAAELAAADPTAPTPADALGGAGTLAVPLALAADLAPPGAVLEEDGALRDVGWLVRPLGGAEGTRALEALVAASERGKFLVLGADNV